MGMSDGTMDWIHIYDFYDCGQWFVYDEEQNYPTTASLSFVQNEWCPSEDNGDDNNDERVIPPGDNTQHNVSSNEERPTMDEDDKTILIVGVAVFVLFCISAIAFF